MAHLRNSPDPLSGSLPRKDLVSWNLYNYSRGDPVNNRDPIGTWNEDDDFTEFDVPASAIGRGTCVTAITPGQFMDFWLLHEIPHSFGNSHPGNNSATTQQAYDKNIWINCFQ